MDRHYRYINIPTEIVRTVVAISEFGSFSKAGMHLGLSQPAISAQMQRLKKILGGAIFVKSAKGVEVTPRGRLILAHAKRLLDANDQILSVCGGGNASQPVRLGLAPIFVGEFLGRWQADTQQNPVSIVCDQSAALAKTYGDGHFDIVCISDPFQDYRRALLSWEEGFVWVRSRDFVLSPGNPIPLIGWPGSPHDASMVSALDEVGLAYRFVLTSADFDLRTSAVAAGLGVMALPLRQVAEPLIVAKEYYLPALNPIRAGILVRDGFDPGSATTLIEALKALAPPLREQNEPRSGESRQT
jgi:DNA-binding transcriptional LysR family regulator